MHGYKYHSTMMPVSGRDEKNAKRMKKEFSKKLSLHNSSKTHNHTYSRPACPTCSCILPDMKHRWTSAPIRATMSRLRKHQRNHLNIGAANPKEQPRLGWREIVGYAHAWRARVAMRRTPGQVGRESAGVVKNAQERDILV